MYNAKGLSGLYLFFKYLPFLCVIFHLFSMYTLHVGQGGACSVVSMVSNMW